MIRTCSLLMLGCVILQTFAQSAALHAQSAAESRRPSWIWSEGKAAVSPQETRFGRVFLVEGLVTAAPLRVAADFCRVRVEINGRPVAAVEPYSQMVEIEVAEALVRGENRIAIVASNVPGLETMAAVALSLTIKEANGATSEVVTDEKWTSRSGEVDRKVTSFGQVEARLWGSGRRPAKIDAFENYEQWRQASGATSKATSPSFWTAPGFEISLVRSAAADEGSWVSLTFDPQGRATIAKEDKGLLRMTLDDSHSSITNVETINDTLLECRGLLYAHDSLYASANNSKGLYRLRDTDGDGKFDDVRLLQELAGGVGHGRNDLALGPDGMIYAINGDSVEIPKEGMIDHTSPLREARREKKSNEGWVWRTDRDGKTAEILCAGMRNPFGIAFNPDGELFTYDADAEFDMGSPWYRPTRVLQLVTGSDFGWRGVTGVWPPYFPDRCDFAPPTLDIGKGSPTAVMFGTATRFPSDYKRALYILDWAYGRIIAVNLAPRGAGYRAQAETFLQGKPLNVTDLAVGPEGDMYLVTGGRKTQSALYRIHYTGQATTDEPESKHEIRCRQNAAKMREIVRLFTKSDDSPVSLNRAWEFLDSGDPIVRNAARMVVERSPVDAWRDRALTENRTTAALEALIVLVRARQADAVGVVIDRLLELPVQDMTPSQAAALVDVYSLCWINDSAAMLARRQRIVDAIRPVADRFGAEPHLRINGTGDLRRGVFRLLVQLGDPGSLDRVAHSMLPSQVQEERLFGLFVLRNVREGWTPESRRAYLTSMNEASTFVAGEGMPRFLENIRKEFVATLTEKETADLAELLKPAAVVEETIAASSRPVVKQWTIDDFTPLLNQPGKGNVERGAVLFREALCVRCHRAGARGPAVGPDLTYVGNRFSRQDLLGSILTPSKVVAENYRGVNVRTNDGRVITGRVVTGGDYRSQVLRIATDPLRPSMIVEIDKKEIEAVKESDVSPMPTGLVDGFTADEVLDLLAYLTSTKS
jgi:putative heme-binding domain-containing protein